jgi:hypothetical protein
LWKAIERLAWQEERGAHVSVVAIVSAYVELRTGGSVELPRDNPALVTDADDVAGTE